MGLGEKTVGGGMEWGRSRIAGLVGGEGEWWVGKRVNRRLLRGMDFVLLDESSQCVDEQDQCVCGIWRRSFCLNAI